MSLSLLLSDCVDRIRSISVNRFVCTSVSIQLCHTRIKAAETAAIQNDCIFIICMSAANRIDGTYIIMYGMYGIIYTIYIYIYMESILYARGK